MKTVINAILQFLVLAAGMLSGYGAYALLMWVTGFLLTLAGLMGTAIGGTILLVMGYIATFVGGLVGIGVVIGVAVFFIMKKLKAMSEEELEEEVEETTQSSFAF